VAKEDEDSHAVSQGILVGGDGKRAHLDFDLALFASFVAYSTITPSLNEVSRAGTTREFEICCYCAVICPSQASIGAGRRGPTKIIGFPLEGGYES
jgi:hypothetical protein